MGCRGSSFCFPTVVTRRIASPFLLTLPLFGWLVCVCIQQTPERVGQSDAVYEVVSLQREAERCSEETGHLTSPTEEEEAEEGATCHCFFMSPPVSGFSCFFFPVSNSNTQTVFQFILSTVAAGMQASPAATVVVRLQPFAHMTQFLHTNINRGWHFPSDRQLYRSGVLQFRADSSSLRTQQNISHVSSQSVASFFCDSVGALASSLISERSPDRLYQSGRPKGNLFKTPNRQVQVAYRGRPSADCVGGPFLNAPPRSWSR